MQGLMADVSLTAELKSSDDGRKTLSRSLGFSKSAATPLQKT